MACASSVVIVLSPVNGSGFAQLHAEIKGLSLVIGLMARGLFKKKKKGGLLTLLAKTVWHVGMSS
jgi:hypothetical protein